MAPCLASSVTTVTSGNCLGTFSPYTNSPLATSPATSFRQLTWKPGERKQARVCVVSTKKFIKKNKKYPEKVKKKRFLPHLHFVSPPRRPGRLRPSRNDKERGFHSFHCIWKAGGTLLLLPWFQVGGCSHNSL